MRGLYIIVEGQTEEQFINEVLRPYFNAVGLYDIRAILIQTSPGYKGGDMKFERYRNHVENLLKTEKDIIVTSLIDFFRLHTDFPKFKESKSIQDKYQRVAFLESAISDIIQENRFIPYIQLHEFEALLFSSDAGFKQLGSIPPKNLDELTSAIESDPEMINDGPATAPSKRMERLVPNYQKAFHGPMLAMEIGMPQILARCHRFRAWTEILINRMTAQ